MKVFNYDEDGHFTGVTNAHPNPEEPGEFLLPARASFMSPPTHDTATHRAKYQGNNAWHVEPRQIVNVNGQQVELRSDADLRPIAQTMLNETTDEILECFENSSTPANDIIVYRRALRKVIRGESMRLPRLLRVPKWPALKGNK